jgi:hypothetical protein
MSCLRLLLNMLDWGSRDRRIFASRLCRGTVQLDLRNVWGLFGLEVSLLFERKEKSDVFVRYSMLLVVIAGGRTWVIVAELVLLDDF